MSRCRWLSRICRLICLLALSGCASKLPHTVAFSGLELEEARSGLDQFLRQPCVAAVDSDVRLSWQAYGSRENYFATLQATQPAFLRFAVVDPLGRPLLLLTADENTYTLADNRNSVAYTGPLDSDFIRHYIPGRIAGRALFFWLSGRVPSQGMELRTAGREVDGHLNWYELDYGDQLIHLLGMDREHLMRHLVLDEDEKILFDVHYSNYADTPEACDWPGRIVVDDEESAASFTLDFIRVYGYGSMEKDFFYLDLPPHFSVNRQE